MPTSTASVPAKIKIRPFPEYERYLGKTSSHAHQQTGKFLIYKLNVGGQSYVGLLDPRGLEPEVAMRKTIRNYFYNARQSKHENSPGLPAALRKLESPDEVSFRFLDRKEKWDDAVAARKTMIRKHNPDLNVNLKVGQEK